MEQKIEASLHGEAIIKNMPGMKIPATAKLRKPSKEGYVIVAPSEEKGNHHVIDMLPGVEIYEDEMGRPRWMVNTVETQVRCLHQDRHDTRTLPPGTWELGGIQQEYDFFAEAKRNVAD